LRGPVVNEKRCPQQTAAKVGHSATIALSAS